MRPGCAEVSQCQRNSRIREAGDPGRGGRPEHRACLPGLRACRRGGTIAEVHPWHAEATMPLSHPSRRPAPAGRARIRAHPAPPGVALLFLLLAAGCGDSTGPGGGAGGDASLSGMVRVAFSATAVPDAVVSLGARSTVTDANGQFELTNLPVGPGTVR